MKSSAFQMIEEEIKAFIIDNLKLKSEISYIKSDPYHYTKEVTIKLLFEDVVISSSKIIINNQ